MEKSKSISMAVIKRLPKYYRYLGELMKNDVDRISSKELGEKIGFTASQIRQDLNCFGDFGQQGYGYNVKELHTQIGSILGLDKSYEAVLIGAGNIGQAVANYIMTLSPERIILGGGVMHQTQLLPLIRQQVATQLNGYIQNEGTKDLEHYIVLPSLDDNQGIMGAIALAKNALEEKDR